jgi:hypothetical protein
MKKTLLAACTAASLVFAGEADLKKFFANFSGAFAATDHKAMLAAEMVHFPLNLKGTLDDSPEAKISPKQFSAVLKKMAHQPSGMNAKDFNETEKDYVTSQAKAGKLPEEAGNGTMRSGNLVFGKKNGRWKLVRVYVSDELIAEIAKNRQ